MEQALIDFKKGLEDYGREKLSQLDIKIDRVENQLSSLDFKTDLFKFEKRLAFVERQRFGVDFSYHNNGDN